MTGKSDFFKGNLNAQQNDQRGWFIGSFLPADSPLRTNKFEAKWECLSAGQHKNTPPADGDFVSLCILISGKFKLIFPENGAEKLLDHCGDYLYYDNSNVHTWEALADSVVLTLRWKRD